MIRPAIDRNLISSLALVSLAVVFLVVVTLTDRRDISSGMVIICATVLFLTGILIFTFSKHESLDDVYVSLLPVQGTINLCLVAADLGIAGSACLLPSARTGHPGVMQFMPVTDYSGGSLSGDSFVSGPGGIGILVPHAGVTLLQHMKKKNQVYFPDNRSDISILIREIAEDTLEVADSCLVTWSEDTVSIEVNGFRLADGCRIISRESPACCTMNPCPFCAMVAACITEGLDRPVRIDRCNPEEKNDVVQIRLTILP